MTESPAEQIEVKRATIGEKLLLRHLVQLYSYDFTEFDHVDVDEDGLYRYDYFDHYWTEENRHPYILRVGGKPAGFAFIKVERADDGSPYTYMAEFFIMKKYRGQGIGQAVAVQLFDRYPGVWEVSEIAQNRPAQAFWRKIIGRYTGGKFEEETFDDGDVLQRFTTSSPGDEASP